MSWHTKQGISCVKKYRNKINSIATEYWGRCCCRVMEIEKTGDEINRRNNVYRDKLQRKASEELRNTEDNEELRKRELGEYTNGEDCWEKKDTASSAQSSCVCVYARARPSLLGDQHGVLLLTQTRIVSLQTLERTDVSYRNFAAVLCGPKQ